MDAAVAGKRGAASSTPSGALTVAIAGFGAIGSCFSRRFAGQLLLPGDTFATRAPHPVLQQLELPHDALPYLGSWKADTGLLKLLVDHLEQHPEPVAG